MMAAPDKTPDRIAGMFDAIAPRYDLLNHLLSAGIDRRWRTRMIASLNLSGGETLIDVCTGTADVALEARRGRSAGARGRAARVLGVDFAGAMLALGLQKIRTAGEQQHIARRTIQRGRLRKIPGALKTPERRGGLRAHHAIDRAAGKSAPVQLDLRFQHRLDRTWQRFGGRRVFLRAGNRHHPKNQQPSQDQDDHER